MKSQSDHSSRVSKGHPKPPASESKKPGKRDKVELSSRADEVRRLTELAKLAPDVRLEKINAIKKQIKAGTYRVPADSVARSIVDLHKKLESDDR